MKLEDLSWAEILAAGTVAGFVIKGMTYIARRVFTFAVLVNTMDGIRDSFNALKSETNLRLNKQDETLASHGRKLDGHSEMLTLNSKQQREILDIVKGIKK